MTFTLPNNVDVKTGILDIPHLLLQTGAKQAEKIPVKRLSYTAETGSKAGRHSVTGNSDYTISHDICFFQHRILILQDFYISAHLFLSTSVRFARKK